MSGPKGGSALVVGETAAVADVVVLGSGTPIADPQRGGSAVAVVADEEWLLVDCGRAATQRAIAAGLDLTAVVAVALTHHHSDHISDLATFATARWTAGATSPLTVIAPGGPAARYAERCLDVFDDESFYAQAPAAAGPRPAIVVDAFDASDELSLVHASGPWRMSSILVQHPPLTPAVGYLVEHEGRRVAVSGDTAVCNGMRRLADRVDVLVHEALLSSRVSRGLLEWNAGARSVGELAAGAHVHALVLTHLIPAPTCAEDEGAYLDEVRAGGFAGPTLVAHDLLRIAITADTVRIERPPDAGPGT